MMIYKELPIYNIADLEEYLDTQLDHVLRNPERFTDGLDTIIVVGEAYELDNSVPVSTQVIIDGCTELNAGQVGVLLGVIREK